MARTLYPAQVAQNYSEAKWSVADDNAQNETKPVAGDTIICTASSGKVTCDEPWAALALSATGACEWDFGAQTASVTNVITLDNMTVTTAAATITGDVNLGDVGGAGTLTMSDTLTIDGGFLLDGGTLTMATNKLTVTGSYIKTSGTMVTPGELEMTGTANLNAGSSNYPAKISTVGAITVTLIGGWSYTNNANIGTGSTLACGAHTLSINPTANDFFACAGTITQSSGYVGMYLFADRTNALPINTNGGKLLLRGNAGIWTMAQSANLSCGDIQMTGGSPTHKGILSMATGAALNTAAVTLGDLGGLNYNGGLILGTGTHTIASITSGHAANLNNAVALDSCTLQCTGAFDTSNIKTISSGACILTFTGGLTIDSTATNNTTWTLAGDTRINGNITLKQTAGTTELDLAGYRLTLRGGDTFTHTAGTLTSGGGSIIANGQTLTNITADAEILVYGGIDGGGNTNLTFVDIISGASSAASPEVGCGNTYGMAELGLGGVH